MRNYLTFLFLLLAINFFAQPFSGIKIGSNLNFFEESKKANDIDLTGNSISNSYKTSFGWQFGYAWNINLNEFSSISFESLLTQRRAYVKTYRENILLSEGKKSALLLSVPVALNYYKGSFFGGAGYEFGYDTGIGNGLNLNTYEHALFLQAGYKIWKLDILLKYGIILNNEDSQYVYMIDNQNNELQSQHDNNIQPYSGIQVPNYSSLQFSIVYSMRKKSKVE